MHLLSRSRRALVALFAVSTLALGSPAFAQSPEEIKVARQTAGEGLQAYNASEYDKALGLFTQARAVYPSAQIIRMIGYSELALERWDKALEALEASLEAKISPLGKDDRKDVQENINKALSHLGLVTITSKVPGAKISVDGGAPRALPLDKPLRLIEGTHKLVVSAPDHLDAVSELKVTGGKPAEIALEPAVKPRPKPVALPPPPPPTPARKEWVPHQRVVGLGAMGAGVAFGAGALITMSQWLHWKGLAADSVDKHLATYGKGCAKGDARLCQYDITLTNREADTADKLRNVSLGLGVTAGVLAATGVVFFVAAPKGKPASDAGPAEPSASLACGPSGGLGVTCSGVF